MKYLIAFFLIVLICVSFVGFKWFEQMKEKESLNAAEKSICPDPVLVTVLRYSMNFLFVFSISSVFSFILLWWLYFSKIIGDSKIIKYFWISLFGIVTNSTLFLLYPLLWRLMY